MKLTKTLHSIPCAWPRAIFNKGSSLRTTKEISGSFLQSFVMCYAIWYHLCNLKNVKNNHGGVLRLLRKQTKKQIYINY